MMIFRQLTKDAHGNIVTEDVGSMGIKNGHIWVKGSPFVVDLAQHPLALPFGGYVDPATEPQKFLDSLSLVFHGTYFWVENEPDDEPVAVVN